MIKAAVVLPIHNEGSRVTDILEKLNKKRLPVFAVNDGSSDSTSKILSESKKKFAYLTVINHKINLGKGAALRTGCDAAVESGAQAIIMMDSDGQHEVEDIDNFLDNDLLLSYDIIFGSRNLTINNPLVRLLGNKFASILVSILFGIYVSDLLCGFRAFNSKIYKKIIWESKGYGVETEMVVKTARYKLKFCEVPVQTIYHDKTKGVTLLDSLGIFFDVLKWKINL